MCNLMLAEVVIRVVNTTRLLYISTCFWHHKTKLLYRKLYVMHICFLGLNFHTQWIRSWIPEHASYVCCYWFEIDPRLYYSVKPVLFEFATGLYTGTRIEILTELRYYTGTCIFKFTLFIDRTWLAFESIGWTRMTKEFATGSYFLHLIKLS